MLIMILPILLVVISNVFYNVSTKCIPQDANSFLSLTVTYLTAAMISFVVFCITGRPEQLAAEFSKLNWTSFVLGISIIGLELGYIFIYRVGWKVSVGSLVANILLACVLLVVGMFLFKEHISLRQLIGMVICAVGLIIITK